MLPALYLLLAPLATVPADDPPVRLRLSSEGQYLPGDRARVFVATADDGYLVVLRADGSGRVRVLFPLDPADDDYVRGGRDFELRGRGARDAFFVDDREGSGLVLAAWSRDPFRFDAFVRGDHWDYRTLGPVPDDPEAGLLDIVHRMAGGAGAGAGFQYDVVRYTVAGRASAYHDRYRHPYRFGLRYRWFYPYHASLFYDPFFYGPYFHDPFCYPFWSCGGAYFFGGFGYPYRYRTPYFRTVVFGRPVRSGSPRFHVPRDRELVRPVEPRRRVAEAEPVTRLQPVEPRRRVADAYEPRGRAPGSPRRWQEPRGGGYEPRSGSPAASPRGGGVRPSNPEPRRAPAPARAAVPVRVRQ